MKKPAPRTWVQWIEPILIRLAVASAVIVMIAQTFLANDYSKQAAVPAFSLEPVKPRVRNSAGILHTPVVTLRLKNFSSLPFAHVLVNGEIRGEFRDRYVTVFVREGDILEVDGTRYKRPFEIEVLDVSKELIYPAAGTKIKVEGNITSLGKIHLQGGEDFGNVAF